MSFLELFYDIARGPLALSAFLIFFTGITFQVLRFFSLSKKMNKTQSRTFRKPFRLSKDPSTTRPLIKSRAQRLAALKVSIIGVHPVMTAVTSIFHLCLVAAPLLLFGHNQLIRESWGISLFSLPERCTDIMTQVVIACALFFLLRRILVAKVRSITAVSDYLILILTVAPFITGFFAFHQTHDYKPLILLHMLSGELMLILLPFTKLVHMIFFFLNRFLIPHENSFGRGTRTWYFGGPRFNFRRWYFGKNEFDIEEW